MSATPDRLTMRTRVLHLTIAFCVALLFTALITLPSPTAIALLPYFPAGLFFLTGPSQQVLVPVAWAVYLTLSIWLLRTADMPRYRALLTALCVLLIVNVAGCYHIFANTHID